MKGYLDNDVVSAIRRQDQATVENAAIREIQNRSRAGNILVRVSKIHERTQHGCPRPTSGSRKRSSPTGRGRRSSRTSGSTASTSQSHGSMIVSPRHEEEPIARRLRQIGLDRDDAHHVMLAIHDDCDVFVTCDYATILRYRAAVEGAFPIRLMRPSEFVQQYAT